MSAPAVPAAGYSLIRGIELDQARRQVSLTYLSVTYGIYRGHVSVMPTAPPGWFAVLVPIAGHSRIRYGGREFFAGRGSAVIRSPVRRLELTWPVDCAQLIFRVDGAVMRDALVEALDRPLDRRGDRPLEFAPEMSLSGRELLGWWQIAQVIIDDLNRGVDPSWTAELERALITRLLVAQPHNYSAELRAAREPMSPDVRRAVGLLESQPQRPWTVGLLARELDLTEWSLQAKFRADNQVPPMRYLCQVRLRRARRDLLRGDRRQGDTVAKVATRWGFTHLSRFTERYRERYGELPSETLSR